MKRLLFCTTLCMAGLVGVWGQTGKPGVVLLPFEAQAGVTKYNAAAVTEIVRIYVVSSNEFTVFENQAVELILNELRVSSYASSDVDLVNAIRSRVAASFIIRGTLSKSNNNIIVTVRLIDAETYYI